MCKQKCENCYLHCSLRKNHEKKIIQQKQQLEEDIKQNTLRLDELTVQFNSCEKIEFESHQQLMKEQEIIKYQIKYCEGVLNIQKIIDLIWRITQLDGIRCPQVNDPQNWKNQEKTLNVEQWVNSYISKQQLPFESQDIHTMIENQNIEIIDSKISSFSKVLQQNQKKLQDLIEKIDKDKNLINNLDILRVDLQNLETKAQQLKQEILQHKDQLEKLRDESRVGKQLLKDFKVDNLDQLKNQMQNYHQQKYQLEQTINCLTGQTEAKKQLIIIKIQEESIQNYIQDLIQQIEAVIQKIQIDVVLKRKQIERKNLLLLALEKKQDQNIQSNLAIQKEIQNLNQEIEAHTKHIEQQQAFIDELNIQLTVDFLNNQEFCKIVIKISCFDMENEIILKKQQLDALVIDSSKQGVLFCSL